MTERCIRGCGDDSGLSAIHDLDSDCAADLPKILYCASGLSVCRHKTSSQLTSVTSLCSATYADNVALPAFARRTPRCCAPSSNRSISPAGRAHSSKPADDRRIDGLCSAYASSATNSQTTITLPKFLECQICDFRPFVSTKNLI